MTTPHPLVLCVDDEPRALAALTGTLQRRYEIVTARTGLEGLDALARHPETAVVISDMQMPGMDGATFLAKAKEVNPDAVRILLTGQADLETAIAAVNQGHIFRFLTKPCPTMTLLSSLYHAVQYHQLLTAERVLLEQTLRGVVETLTDMLSIISPASFARASRIRARVTQMADALEMKDRWHVEVAAMLSQLGSIGLGPDAAARVYDGRPLSADDVEAQARVPALTDRLLAHIPRLEIVRAMLAATTEPYHAVDPAADGDEAALIMRGAQMLKVASDFDVLETEHTSSAKALELMVERGNDYDPEVLILLPLLLDAERSHEQRTVSLGQVEVGMIVAEDVRVEESGALLVARGLPVTASMKERLRHFTQGTVKKAISVLIPLVLRPFSESADAAADVASPSQRVRDAVLRLTRDLAAVSSHEFTTELDAMLQPGDTWRDRSLEVLSALAPNSGFNAVPSLAPLTTALAGVDLLLYQPSPLGRVRAAAGFEQVATAYEGILQTRCVRAAARTNLDPAGGRRVDGSVCLYGLDAVDDQAIARLHASIEQL